MLATSDNTQTEITMAETDRNIWDPKTPTDPPGYTELTRRGLVVDLCIYILEHSAKDERMVRTDVQGAPGIQGASEIWCQSTINIQVVQLKRLSSLPTPAPSENDPNPIDFNQSDLAGQMPCPLPEAVIKRLLNIPKSEMFDPTQSVAVFYIPGRRLQNGGTGCHTFYLPVIDLNPQHCIVLTDEANASVLAHELGHALFTRNINAHTWINHDPDSKRNPSDPIHNTDSENLMYPKVHDNPVISLEQSAQAKKCLLTHDRRLVFGFKENKNFKLGVKFKNMDVHHSSDEAGSDDALESSWTFKASIVRSSDGFELTSKTENWNQDPLHWWNYELNKDLSPLEVSSDTDKLIVEVTGSDWDFSSPNDTLPSIREEWLKAGDTWGSESTNIVGGQLGDHIEHRSSDDIDYSLIYNIRVVDRPKETVFRALC
jgi:hypothetical protein